MSVADVIFKSTCRFPYGMTAPPPSWPTVCSRVHGVTVAHTHNIRDIQYVFRDECVRHLFLLEMGDTFITGKLWKESAGWVEAWHGVDYWLTID